MIWMYSISKAWDLMNLKVWDLMNRIGALRYYSNRDYTISISLNVIVLDRFGPFGFPNH